MHSTQTAILKSLSGHGPRIHFEQGRRPPVWPLGQVGDFHSKDIAISVLHFE